VPARDNNINLHGHSALIDILDAKHVGPRFSGRDETFVEFFNADLKTLYNCIWVASSLGIKDGMFRRNGRMPSISAFSHRVTSTAGKWFAYQLATASAPVHGA